MNCLTMMIPEQQRRQPVDHTFHHFEHHFQKVAAVCSCTWVGIYRGERDTAVGDHWQHIVDMRAIDAASATISRGESESKP